MTPSSVGNYGNLCCPLLPWLNHLLADVASPYIFHHHTSDKCYDSIIRRQSRLPQLSFNRASNNAVASSITDSYGFNACHGSPHPAPTLNTMHPHGQQKDGGYAQDFNAAVVGVEIGLPWEPLRSPEIQLDYITM